MGTYRRVSLIETNQNIYVGIGKLTSKGQLLLLISGLGQKVTLVGHIA